MRINLNLKDAIIFSLSLFLLGCKSVTPTPAPVSEISVKSDTAVSSNKTPAKSNEKQDKDWRPDLYTVKKGDTLYSIGLEHGFDYKEIAQLNQIEPPYII